MSNEGLQATVTELDWFGGSVKARETLEAFLAALPEGVAVYSLGIEQGHRPHVDLVLVGDYKADGLGTLVRNIGTQGGLAVTPIDDTRKPSGKYLMLFSKHDSTFLNAYRPSQDAASDVLATDCDPAGRHLADDMGVVKIHLIGAKEGTLGEVKVPYSTPEKFEEVANALGFVKDVNYKRVR